MPGELLLWAEPSSNAPPPSGRLCPCVCECTGPGVYGRHQGPKTVTQFGLGPVPGRGRVWERPEQL